MRERYVAFGAWSCGCTILTKTLGEVPARCPTHDAPLLDVASWVFTDAPLGVVAQ